MRIKSINIQEEVCNEVEKLIVEEWLSMREQ
jgi:hypothetical protein